MTLGREMTVSELIEQLQELPQDLPVVIDVADEGVYGLVEGITIQQKIFLAMNRYREAVLIEVRQP